MTTNVISVQIPAYYNKNKISIAKCNTTKDNLEIVKDKTESVSKSVDICDVKDYVIKSKTVKKNNFKKHKILGSTKTINKRVKGKKLTKKLAIVEEIFNVEQIDFEELSLEEVEYSMQEQSGDLFSVDQINFSEMLESNAVEKSMEEQSGDLFNVVQIDFEELSLEEIESSMQEQSGDLFNVEQIDFNEMLESNALEKNMEEQSGDLFNVSQVDFEEMSEIQMQIAEKSMWNETGEVEFE